MREIKFRAWVGKMFYFSWHDIMNLGVIHVREGDYLRPYCLGCADCPPEDHPPIMQYTGLKDKYGKEVYEGDILRWKNALGYGEEIGSVGWGDDGFVWEGIPLAQHVAGLEIIGNIYENPELLK